MDAVVERFDSYKCMAEQRHGQAQVRQNLPGRGLRWAEDQGKCDAARGTVNDPVGADGRRVPTATRKQPRIFR